MKMALPKLTLPALITSAALGAGTAFSATILPSDDNFVNSSGDSGSVDDQELRMKADNSNIRKAWLRFDLTGQNVDTSQSATVTLTISRAASQNFVLSLFALNSGFEPDTGELDTDWTEGAITFANAPGNTDATSQAEGNGVDSDDATLISSTAIPNNTAAGTSYTFTLTNLSDYLQADNSITIMALDGNPPSGLIGGTGDGTGGSTIHYIASSENTNVTWRPTFTFSQIPEPSAALLGVIGSLFLLRRKRN